MYGILMIKKKPSEQILTQSAATMEYTDCISAEG